jgi:methyl-accepting chemotaxis protein
MLATTSPVYNPLAREAVNAAPDTDARTNELFAERYKILAARTDRIFAYLMAGQWLFGIFIAVVLSPYAWAGRVSSIGSHVVAAIFLGGLFSSMPIFLALTRPGEPITRHTIAVGQVLWSGLLIHLTGGRIESHFHIFGSLALLAFYRDYKVLIPATLVIAVDHLLRQLLWPESIYGVAGVEWWRFLEHAAWVVFENVFLTINCVYAVQELREICAKQVEVERSQNIQNDIHQLLRVVADASDGDLTVRAEIGAGALGSVADAFNSLLESLQRVLGRVQSQINSTNEAVAAIRTSSVKMAAGAATQTKEVQSATQLVERMTLEISRVSSSASQAADAAKRTEVSAQEGTKAVQDVISGMGTLRANVQAGAKKMKTLGDRSMEINGIVGTISRISEQTNMLALNAAIEAARAGEHGRGFSVVAEEVRKLAERTASATQEIDKLVKTIHAETNETVEAIEKQTQVVEQESHVVGRAGESLSRIRTVSSESANIVLDISNVARKQAEGTGAVVRVMEQISSIAQATQHGVEGTTATATMLSQLSEELTRSIAQFKVA